MSSHAMPQLRNWSVVIVPSRSNPYREPRIRLGGLVSDHPDHYDGKDIVTSKIMDVKGRMITVESGNVYELVGDPEPAYLAYLRCEGKIYDAINPITIHKAGE